VELEFLTSKLKHLFACAFRILKAWLCLSRGGQERKKEKAILIVDVLD
jgi:hypothetical protein